MEDFTQGIEFPRMFVGKYYVGHGRDFLSKRINGDLGRLLDKHKVEHNLKDLPDEREVA